MLNGHSKFWGVINDRDLLQFLVQGFTFVLFLHINIDCGYSLEPSQYEAILKCTPDLCFEPK